jgi:hypothetical protein
MKTNDLIALLANGDIAVEPNAVPRRFALAMGWGACGATLLMAIWLGVRADIAKAALLPMFWVKLAYPAVILAGALMVALRLSRPGVPLGRVPLLIAAPVLAMGLLAAAVLWHAAPELHERLIYGVSWTVCPFYIASLSAPVFVAALWAMYGFAPTRPALAGASAGLLAGATGALVYALYCPEMAAPFLAIWYLAGMLIPAVFGAVVGLKLLRW